MKIIVLSLLSFFSFLLYTQQPPVKEVEFSKISRGYEEHIRINRDSVHTFKHDIKNEKPAVKFRRSTTKAEWTHLVRSLDHVKLQEVESLVAPSMNRTSDAAMHGTLSISVGDESYTHGFDDENPNEVLMPLMKAIRDIAGDQQD